MQFIIINKSHSYTAHWHNLRFYKTRRKPFYRQNDFQNRFTENAESADYDGGKNNVFSAYSFQK